VAVTLLDDRGRVLKTIHTDAHDENRMVEVMTEDITPLIELARSTAIARKLGRGGVGSLEKLFGAKLVGVMPDFQVEKMVRDGSWNDPQAVKRWFNDPQNKDFRVWEGRV
jgi:hypothetical protein